MNDLNLGSFRARKARFAGRVAFSANKAVPFIIVLLLVFGLVAVSNQDIRTGYLAIAAGLSTLMWHLWVRRDLLDLTPGKAPQSLDDILEPKLLAKFKKSDLPLTPQNAWQVAATQWQVRFLCNRLLIPPDQIGQTLSASQADMPNVWAVAQQLMAGAQNTQLDAGDLAAALITTSEPTKAFLTQVKLRPEEVIEVHNWLERLRRTLAQPRPYFGGIGRDWATGYTPSLEQFGQNISMGIQGSGGHFHTLAHNDIVDTIVYSLGKGIGGVALVGETGSGKTSLVYALAQRLLEGHDKELQHYQIVSLNASMILSSAKDKLESTLLTILSEAVHAGNIVIFLDEAHLFLGDATGSFDASRVLQPILQRHQLKIIAAFTPNEFQRLRANNESLAASFTTVSINEPDQATTMSILEDTALMLEQQSKYLVSYQAVREAYRLSGQYMQEEAYPGKAINLLDQSAAYAENNVITAQSVALSIEKTRGVKVSAVQGAEADTLLNLEDRIHSRMINQTKAVTAVSTALRRNRAGVSTSKRPVGSFLFLGPTGVGKTELARSLAATYYGDETQMIRLDMSEYQQASDVDRLLSDGGESAESLILAVRKQPFSVILLDEVEKAHPNILNLLLQMLDEGKLTDKNGRPAQFNSAIIIATSNAGSADITQRIASGQNLDGFDRPLIDSLIAKGQFKPELINRFDEVVLFRPLNQAELGQVAVLMIKEVNKTLAAQNITVQLTEAALAHVIQQGYDPEFGARPMRRVVQKLIEDAMATRILKGEVQPGQTVTLDVGDLAQPSA